MSRQSHHFAYSDMKHPELVESLNCQGIIRGRDRTIAFDMDRFNRVARVGSPGSACSTKSVAGIITFSRPYPANAASFTNGPEHFQCCRPIVGIKCSTVETFPHSTQAKKTRQPKYWIREPTNPRVATAHARKHSKNPTNIINRAILYYARVIQVYSNPGQLCLRRHHENP